MDPRAIFGINTLASLVSSIVAAVLFAWPWLRDRTREEALTWLVAPHMFLRFLGLSFLVPGVVAGALPRAWAMPAAYGDFVAAILAILASVGLMRRRAWAIPSVWLFNLWGAADLLFAFFQGVRVQLQPGSLGAGYYLVTDIVPPLLVSHGLIFRLLLRAGPPSRGS